MIGLIATFLVKKFTWDEGRAKRIAWILLAAGVLFLVLLVVGLFKLFGGTREVKIDEQSLQKINSVNEKERKAELREIIAENSDVVKTVDERTELAEVNRVERERATDEKIAVVDRKIQEAKAQGKDVSSAELECLLIPENCK